MKNKNIFWFIAITVLLLWLGFNIGDGRLRIGTTAYINDTTTAWVSVNKGIVVNGDLYTDATGNYYLSDGTFIYMGDQSNYPDLIGITGQINQIMYNASVHNFNTPWGQTLATLDSASGFTTSVGDNSLGNYTQLGSSAPYIKTKLIAFKLSGSASTSASAPHGVSNWKDIISFASLAREDSAATEVLIPHNHSTGAYNYNAYVDSLNCTAITGASATVILNDSVFFYLTIRK